MAALFLLIASVVLRRSGVGPLLAPEEVGAVRLLILTLAGTVGVGVLGIAAGWLPWNRPSRGHAAWSRSARRTRWITAIACSWLSLCVLGFGWFDLVRETMGDWILLDEAAAISPAIVAMLLGWWGHGSYVERSVAAPGRTLAPVRPRGDEPRGPELAEPVERFARSRVGFVITQARIFLPLLLAPVAAVLATQEIVERLMHSFDAGANVREMIGLAAAIAALLLAPALVLPALSTAPLPPRDGLAERVRELFAANRIGLRGVRLWNTGGTLMNGVALGVLPFCRWVLLSDALVEGLAPDETLAVTGHEAGHLRHRHALWLAGACIGSLGCLGAIVGALAPSLPREPWVEWTVMALVMIIVILCFGAVSRACERQADAFAVSVLSPGEHVDPRAVEAMRRALAVVAYANGIPPRRPSFRHGSIDGRRRRLAALAEAPKSALPIDRRMRLIRRLILASLVVTAVAAV